MKISLLLFGRQALPRKMFSGKNRLPRHVSINHKRHTLDALTLEEENLFYLRQPYLTKEQEDRYLEIYIKPKEAQTHVTTRRIHNNVTAVERLKHLCHTSSWE